MEKDIIKIKFPKKITILSHTLKVKKDKSHAGGSFDLNKGVVEIGTRDLKIDPLYTLSVISHEISEAIHAIMCTRYDDRSEYSSYKFIMTHRQFQIHNQILTENLLQFVKQ